MPRALKVVIECDQCSQEIDGDEFHEGALLLEINGSGKRQVDLCHECLRGASNTSPWSLVMLYDQADTITEPRPTRRAARNTNTSTPAPCPYPSCGHVAGSPQGLGRHARTAHGMTVDQIRESLSDL